MQVRDAIALGRERLSGVTEVAQLETEWLLEWVLKESRVFLLLNAAKSLSAEESIQFEKALERRCAGEPLQYIIGTQEFMGLEFDVTPDVLIPRRDTECLVELIVDHYRGTDQALTISDLGSGSGAIGVSIAYYLKKAFVTCVDLSAAALAMTRRNADKLLENPPLARFRTVHEDMFKYLEALTSASQDLIVSNPPYIPSADIETLQVEVKVHEPRTALDGGEDGLDYYRRLIKEAKDKLKPGAWMLFEVGHDQGTLVKQLFLDDGGYEDIQCYRDLQGIDRIVGAHKK